MHAIYLKSFIFGANRFEEWSGGRCLSSGPIDTIIVSKVNGNTISFELDDIQSIRMRKSFSVNSHGRGEDVDIFPDRIQYVSDTLNFEPTNPIVCNIFYKGDKVEYVRFGMTCPDRIVEFYGDVVSMGNIDFQEDDAFADKAISQTLEFVFVSNCHQRYESNVSVMGLQNCVRTVSVEKNTNGCEGYRLTPGDGYIVKIFNDDLNRPNMTDKPMRVVRRTSNMVELRGFPIDAISPWGWMELDYRDYGFFVYYENGEVSKCVLYMYDRDIRIEYMCK